MIKQFRVQNYKCLRDVTLDLTPIHVLIGPNDSGKTSILEAMAALCRSVDYPLHEAFAREWEGRSLVWRGEQKRFVAFEVEVGDSRQPFSCSYSLSCRFHSPGRRATCWKECIKFPGVSTLPLFPDGDEPFSNVYRIKGEAEVGPAEAEAAGRLHQVLSGVHLYQWNPAFLALPVAPDAKRRFRMEPSGFGLALCLDDILGYDRGRFDSLESRFRETFPDIKSIKLIPEPAYRAAVGDPTQIPMLERRDGKGIYFEFAGSGQLVSASQASDGVLLVLAYLTILHLPQPPRVILVEEPENGIHPKRLQDVLKILRDLVEEQDHTQVVLTTHSPYVVDMFKPEEVTLCHKDKDGAVSVSRLSESKTVREQLDVFTLGEIWTAEGDEALAQPGGKDEEAGR